MGARGCHVACVEVRGQRRILPFPLYVVGFSVLISGHQAQWQVPLPSVSLPCPRTHFVVHVGLEFVVILLSLLPE